MSRIPTIIISAIGLLAVPIGTLINGYILYKVASQQRRHVLTPEYHEVVVATPHVKRKSSLLKLFLIVLLIIILIGVLAGLLLK